MLRQTLAALITRAIEAAQQEGRLPAIALPEVIVEHPQNESHGDYATSIALKLARATGLNPMAVAGEITGHLPPAPEIDRATIAPPGFINLTLNSGWLCRQVEPILARPDTYGNINLGNGKRVQIEFVSVNPTGPLHVGHGRGAVLGSTLANTLTAAGYSVSTEHYTNDAGNQVANFARSLYARYQQTFHIDAEMPADGYFGSYLVDLAGEIAAEEGDRLLNLPEEEAVSRLQAIGLEKMLARARADLAPLGVSFNVWFSERSLYREGQYDTAISRLRQAGYLAERAGATWFVSTALGEDKDNVIVRSDGSPTYFAGDIAYHYNKFVERGFDEVIDIWGADHQGHVSRMKAVIEALGIDPARLKIIISQLVTLRRGGEPVRISKRSGDIITLRELVDEVGADACRFFFLSRSASSQMDFDMELAKKQSADNPVYYVQYAHARIASILRTAAEKGIDTSGDSGDASLLTAEAEQLLIKKMLQLPEIVEISASTLEPHHFTYYAQELATVFHSFYKQCRVISEDPALTRSRLKLVRAARLVLGRILHLMGMNAPERM